MGIDLIPANLRAKFKFEERLHACAILRTDFPNEWQDILACLKEFTLKQSEVLTAGGNKSPISKAIDAYLNDGDGVSGHLILPLWLTGRPRKRRRTRSTTSETGSALKSSGTTKTHSSTGT